MRNLIGAVLGSILLACGQTETTDRYFRVTEPAGVAGIIYPADNPTTKAGLALGEALFFETALSVDSTLSCAGCHRPELAFTDGRAVAVGVRGQVGLRNTPGLTNIGYLYRSMFWDGRADDLEAQALHPIDSPAEMGNDWPTVVARLTASEGYRKAFGRAFGTETVSPELVGKALAQYQRSLISANSKYDRVVAGEEPYTAAEALGHAIFFDLADDPSGPFANLPRGECAHCHTPPHFTDQRFANNGLDFAETLAEFSDAGRGAISGNPYDNGRFRTPGLRNVDLTAPYMHDGRIQTLEEVVHHYNTGGHYAENRSPNVRPLGMSPEQEAALVAFLTTLTDTSFVNRAVLIN